MNNRCPNCQIRLTDSPVSCDQCDWTLGTNHQASGTESEAAIQTPDILLQQIMSLIDEAKLTTALDSLNRVIDRVGPDRLAECYSLRGYVHLKNFDFEEAENDFTEAIKHDNEDPQTFAWRAAARGEQYHWAAAFDDLDCAGTLAGANRDTYLELMETYAKSASDYFRTQIKQGDESSHLFFERGWIYFRCGKHEKARRDLGRALAMEPGHPRASLGLAKIKLENGQTTGLRTLCLAAIQGDAACEQAALEIQVQLNHDAGNLAETQQGLHRITELARGDPQSLVQCCEIRQKMGDSINAIAGLNEVINGAPEMMVAYRVRGDCYREIKNYAMAIKDYSQYLSCFPDDTKSLIQRATLLLATGRLGLARNDIVRVMAMDEAHSEAYLIRSKIFLAEDELGQALTDCQNAVRLDHHRLDAFGVLAQIYFQLCNFTRAIQEYSRCVELSKSNEEKAQFLYLRGAAYYELNRFPESLSDFDESSRLRPNHSGCWVWKAAACSRMEDWTGAIRGLQRAMETRPSNSGDYQKMGQPIAKAAIVFLDQLQQRGNPAPAVFKHRGMAHQFLGNADHAIDDYTMFLSHVADDPETLFRRGEVLALQGNHQSAIKDFTKVIRRDSGRHDARYRRAISRAARQEWDAARSDLIKAITEAPEHPRYHVFLGELRNQKGALKKSIEAYDNAIFRDPTDPETYRRRGVAQLQTRDYLSAIRDFTHSIELYPNQAETFVLRGQAYHQSGQPLLAIEDFEIALSRDHELASAYSGRAAVLLEQGKFEYTLIWLTKAIHRFTQPAELAEIVFARGQVFFQMGRLAPAIADFTAVIELTRTDKTKNATARFSRAVANLHCENYETAKKDFERLSRRCPQEDKANRAIEWLENRQSPRPDFLETGHHAIRPTRPPVSQSGVRLVESVDRWSMTAPYETWVIRTHEKKEFGPVHYDVLKKWISEGRVGRGMKVLRADWSKWKRAEKVFIELSPLDIQPTEFDDFPGIRSQ